MVSNLLTSSTDNVFHRRRADQRFAVVRLEQPLAMRVTWPLATLMANFNYGIVLS
jgi:hypothetical protein